MIEKDKKYKGIVKWFGNRRTGEEEGFIYNNEIGDVYVHRRSLRFEVKPLDIVQFNIKESKRGGGNTAFDVEKITEDTYLEELLDLYLNWELLSEFEWKDKIQKQIYITSNNSNLLLTKPLRQILDQFIEEKIDSYIKGESITSSNLYNLFSKIKEIFCDEATNRTFERSVSDNLVEYFVNAPNKYVILLGWYGRILGQYPLELIKMIYKFGDNYLQSELIGRVNANIVDEATEMSIATFKEIPPQPSNPYSREYEFLSPMKYEIDKFLKELGKRNVELSKKYLLGIYPKCSRELKFELWLKWDFLEFTNDIKELILEKFDNFNGSTINQILNKFNDLDSSTLKKFVENLSSRDPNTRLGENFKTLLDRWKGTTLEPYYNQIINSLPIEKKVEIWIEGYLDFLDISEITADFHLLSHYYQELTIKKIFNYYTDKTKDRIIEFINKVLEKLKSSSNDFEVLIELNLISQTIKGEKFQLKELIIQALQLINQDKRLTSFVYNSGDLLEKCSGRGMLSKDYDGEFVSKSMNVPDGIIYCEGRKAIDVKTNKPSLNKNKEFYWCKNKPCFKNEINIKRKQYSVEKSWFKNAVEGETWSSQRLYEILRTIDGNYTIDTHSYNLGLVNKFYNYFKHLQCKSCNSWLTPILQSNYAYDRVNHFMCEKNDCAQKGKEIYISHCLNFRCNNIVDSRNSQQCPHSWFICDYCLSCCSTEKLNTRKEIRAKTGQEYFGPEKGHDELNKIFCFKCGNKLSILEKEFDQEIIKETFDSFQRITGLSVDSSGVQKKGRKWILVKLKPYSDREYLFSKLKVLEDDGLIISETENGNGYFINEPISKRAHYLNCSNTDCKLNLYLESLYVNDKEKANALRHHKEIETLFKNLENNYE